MKNMAKKAFSVLLACALGMALCPASALATSGWEGVDVEPSVTEPEGDNNFQSDAVKTGIASQSTTVNLKAIDTSYQIVAVSNGGTYLPTDEGGMWVQTAYGDASCTLHRVTWYRIACKEDTDPELVPESSTKLYEDYVNGLVENGKFEFAPGKVASNVPAVDQTMFKYVYWATVEEFVSNGYVMAKNNADPAGITQVMGHWFSGPLYDDDGKGVSGDWVWSAWGAQDGAPGATGLFPQDAQLQSTDLNEGYASQYTAIKDAIEGDPEDPKEELKGAWDLQIATSTADAKGAFVNKIRMTVDATPYADDILGALEGGTLTGAQARAKLEAEFRLYSVKGLPESVQATGLTASYRIERDDGGQWRAYIDYFTDDKDARLSGDLGTVALSRKAPAPGVRSYMVEVVIEPSAADGVVHGTSSVNAGSRLEYEGADPTYCFTPEGGYYGVYTVEKSTGAGWQALGTEDYEAGVNFVTLHALEQGDALAGMRVTVRFEPYDKPDEPTEFKVTLQSVSMEPAGAGVTQLELTGAGNASATLEAGKSAMLPADTVGMRVLPPAGYTASKAVITWSIADDKVEGGNPQTVLFENNVGTMGMLQAAASIELYLVASTVDPTYVDAVVAAPARPYFTGIDSDGVQAVPLGGTASFDITAPVWSTIKAVTVLTEDGRELPEGDVAVTGIGEATGSLVVYNVSDHLAISAEFAYQERKVVVPAIDEVPGLAAISPSGTHVRPMDPANPMQVLVRISDDYELPEGAITLAGKLDGRDVSVPATVVRRDDGTYLISVGMGDPKGTDHALVPGYWDADAGITVVLAPEKKPVEEVFHRIDTIVRAGVPAGSYVGDGITQSFQVIDGAEGIVQLFPAPGYVASVYVDGAPLTAVEAGGDPDGNVVFYDGTSKGASGEHYRAPTLIIREVRAGYAVQAVFAAPSSEEPEAPKPPAEGYKDRVEVIGKVAAAGTGSVEPGAVSAAYIGSDTAVSALPAEFHTLDMVAVDGVTVFFDGAHLRDDAADMRAQAQEGGVGCAKDSPGALAAARTAGLDAQGPSVVLEDLYFTVDGSGAYDFFSVTFDEASDSGRLVFYDVQRSHEIDVDFCPFKGIQLIVEGPGGDVSAPSAKGLKQFKWKVRKGLEVYLTPEAGYDISTAVLTSVGSNGTVETTDLIAGSHLEKMSTSDVPADAGEVRPQLLSELVAAVTMAQEAHAATASATSYRYVMPLAQMRGQSMTLRATFAKEGSGAQDVSGMRRVNVDVRSGSGFVKDATGAQVSKASFTVRRNQGFAVEVVPDLTTPYVYMQIGSGARTYCGRVKQVSIPAGTADVDVHIDFTSAPYKGDNGDGARALKRLQALARTGDLNAPVALGLLAVAFAACGVAMLSSNRRRKEESA